MEIYFATTNKGKVNSLKRDLKECGISIIQKPIELIEPRSSDVKEIAFSKIQQAYSQIQKPTVVIDAGFYIESLNGFPRAFVNFALDTVGLEGILKLVEGKSRKCEFRECLAYMDGSLEEPKYFISHIKGEIADELKGEMKKHFWSKLGLIFVPDENEKTLAEMSYDEYLFWRETLKEKKVLARENFYKWIVEK